MKYAVKSPALVYWVNILILYILIIINNEEKLPCL